MAFVFLGGLFLYYFFVLRRFAIRGSALALLLWILYTALGVSSAILEATAGIKPIFEPNYSSVLVLLVGVFFSISGFLLFRPENISRTFDEVRFRTMIENILVATQIYSIVFFLPFAMSSFVGDVNENRLLLAEKMEVMGSFGLLNTFAGAASQLFPFSLVLAFSRLLSNKNGGRNVSREGLQNPSLSTFSCA